MTTVSSLVVQRRLATLRQVEEALARQVLYGGDVVTNLLEVAGPPATDEEQLTIALADALGIAPANIESMRSPDPEAVARVPRALAEEHGFVPIARSGDALVVALAEPLAESTVEALREKLGALKQVAAPLFRLRQALERAYGLSMDRRTRTLAAALDGEEAPADSLLPPPSQLGSVFARTLAIPELREEDKLARSPVRASETPKPSSAQGALQGATLGIAKDPSRPPPATTIRSSNPGPSALQWFLKSAQDRASAPNPQVAPPAPPVAAPSMTGRPSSPSSPRFSITGRKRRGPFSRNEAEHALSSAERSEIVFAAFFEFAQQYVAYAALFLVKEDIAEGWEANGPGASGDRVRKMGVPLDLPSLFSAAVSKRMPVLHKGPRGELDEVIVADLDRAESADHTLVLPIVVGKRVVALLYGDDAREPMALDELGDVVSLAAAAATALARIIVRRKTKGTGTVASSASIVPSIVPEAPIARSLEKQAPIAPLPPLRTTTPTPPVVARPSLTPPPPSTSTSREMRAQRMRPNRPDLATRARALTAALTGTPKTPPAAKVISPSAVSAPSATPSATLSATPPSPVTQRRESIPVPALKPVSIAPPALHVAPEVAPGGQHRSITPAPYQTISDAPPRRPELDRSPVPDHKPTIPRMPALPKALSPGDSVPMPGQGRTTDPLFSQQHVPVESPDSVEAPVEIPTVPTEERESTAPRRASIARIELRTIAAVVAVAEAGSQEKTARAHAESAVVEEAESDSSADAAFAALLEASASPSTAPARPSATSLDAVTEKVPEVLPRPSLEPGEAAMPMAPPPLLTGKRKLVPTIPREEPAILPSGTPSSTPSSMPSSMTPSGKDTSSAEAQTPPARPSKPSLVVVESMPPPPNRDHGGPEITEAAEVTDEELEELLAEAAPAYREGERIEAYPPRPPPRPQPVVSGSGELAKVIIALDPEVVALVVRLLKGGEAGEVAKASLKELGVAALAPIMSRFPGPTQVDRHVPPSQLPTPADAGPLLGLLVDLDRLALREIFARVSDPNPETRFWATHLLTDIVDEESAPVLVPRLVDDDIAVRRVAALAARALVEQVSEAASVIVEPLIGVVLDAGATASLRVRAALALGEVRDARAVEGLILGLESYEKDVGRACHDALVVLARTDPTRQGSTWPAWFNANKDRSRIEWLIDALMEDDEPTREAAAAELKARTKMYFGYYANLSKGEREGAQRRYRTWWETEGRRKLAARPS